MKLARAIYGDFAPEITEHGQVGGDADGEREPLVVYVMNRIKGISHLDFILASISVDQVLLSSYSHLDRCGIK